MAPPLQRKMGISSLVFKAPRSWALINLLSTCSLLSHSYLLCFYLTNTHMSLSKCQALSKCFINFNLFNHDTLLCFSRSCPTRPANIYLKPCSRMPVHPSRYIMERWDAQVFIRVKKFFWPSSLGPEPLPRQLSTLKPIQKLFQTPRITTGRKQPFVFSRFSRLLWKDADIS